MYDHRIALIARFWAAMTMTVHGAFWAVLFYAQVRSPEEYASAPSLVAMLILAGSAASAGWGLHRAKRSHNSIFVPLACAPVLVAVFLHWLVVPVAIPPALAHTSWVLYTLWVAPALLAVVFGVWSTLTQEGDGPPGDPPEPERTAVPVPIMSSVVATLVYAVLGVLLFGLTAAFSTDYMPETVVLGAIAMCFPFVFYSCGLSSALARHTKRARPLLASGLLSLVIMIPALMSVFGGFGLLLCLGVALPLIWPTARAWQIIRAEGVKMNEP